MTRLLQTIWTSILLLSTAVTPVHGFASWLRCYVELETDEVVMNHHIQPSSEAELKIPIQIKNEETSWSSSAPSITNENDSILQIRLDFPEELIKQDVQWVIEVTPEGAAEFVDIGRMCEGTRAFSKNDEPVTLIINDASTPIKLVAGYAAGHEAVILTPPMHIGNNNIGNKPTENGTTKEL
mmetsp:Transcript_37225/g.90418  ORF Transcript_37225/g.90418 Transcript_37225/m.90418 type:complete len:182 (+) Transcript_37225:167-712(+)